MTLPERILTLLAAEPDLTHAQLQERLSVESGRLGETLRRLQREGRVTRSGRPRSLVYRAAPVVRLDLSPRAHHWLAQQARASGRTLEAEAAEVIERQARAS